MKPLSIVSLILVLVIAGCAAPTVASAPPPARDDSPDQPSTLDQYHRAAVIAAERAGDTERAAAHRSYLAR